MTNELTPTCYLMVGLPALGKSTFIKKIKTSDNWIYSTDMYIEAVAEDNGISYSEAFESNIQAATEFNERKLESMMHLQKDIIWDQTNISSKKRKRIIDRMKKSGYKVFGIYLMHPEPGEFDDLKIWKYRLANRDGKVIPNHVISNMLENFVKPSLDEGFDRLQTYNMHGILVETHEMADFFVKENDNE